jgi:hypothetical protein
VLRVRAIPTPSPHYSSAHSHTFTNHNALRVAVEQAARNTCVKCNVSATNDSIANAVLVAAGGRRLHRLCISKSHKAVLAPFNTFDTPFARAQRRRGSSQMSSTLLCAQSRTHNAARAGSRWLHGCSIPHTVCIRSLDDPISPFSSRLTGFRKILASHWSIVLQHRHGLEIERINPPSHPYSSAAVRTLPSWKVALLAPRMRSNRTKLLVRIHISLHSLLKCKNTIIPVLHLAASLPHHCLSAPYLRPSSVAVTQFSLASERSRIQASWYDSWVSHNRPAPAFSLP